MKKSDLLDKKGNCDEKENPIFQYSAHSIDHTDSLRSSDTCFTAISNVGGNSDHNIPNSIAIS